MDRYTDRQIIQKRENYEQRSQMGRNMVPSEITRKARAKVDVTQNDQATKVDMDYLKNDLTDDVSILFILKRNTLGSQSHSLL